MQPNKKTSTKQAYFITGTDTGVGKTYFACQLISHFVSLGYQVVGMKPIAAGEDFVDGEWVNDDVLKLEAASNVKAPRELTNPYSFKEPIAPHIAAERANVSIELSIIHDAYNKLIELADIVIVEGAGGFLVPISESENMADLIQVIDLPIILVVRMKLGCINHTALTLEAINARNIPLAGWVANQNGEVMDFFTENVTTIARIAKQKNKLLTDFS
jgi:dethiobiotin synthetase